MFEAVVFVAGLLVGAPDTEVERLLRAADAPRRAFLGSRVHLRATLHEPDRDPKTSEFVIYIGDEDRQLVEFQDKKQRGRKYLARGNESWLIVPGARHPIAITANQRLFGSLSFADVARVRLAQDYDGTLRQGRETCDEGPDRCRVIDIHARDKNAPYAAGSLWIDDSGLLRRAEYRLASGKPAKRIRHEYSQRAGKIRLIKSDVIDQLAPQHELRTELEYLSHEPFRVTDEMFDPKQAASP